MGEADRRGDVRLRACEGQSDRGRAARPGGMIKKSKGDPRKLTAKERERLRTLVTKGATGKRR